MICRTKSKIWDVIVLREVCVRFRYLIPFPSISHRFDHEIREDRATQEVNPFIRMGKNSGRDLAYLMMHLYQIWLGRNDAREATQIEDPRGVARRTVAAIKEWNNVHQP